MLWRSVVPLSWMIKYFMKRFPEPKLEGTAML